MGKNRDKYVARDMDSDDDSSDMEATGAAVLAEERRACVLYSFHCFPPLLGLMNRIALAYSARLASKEDAEEQERLRVAAEKKARMKAAAKSGGNAR